MTGNEANHLEYAEYHKTGLTRARRLTEQDWQDRQGVIATLENPAVGFIPGDYLCLGVQEEEWPTSAASFEATKRTVSGPDEAGFCLYATTTTVLAVAMPHEFEVRLVRGAVLQGKAGDYLVKREGRLWVVDRAVFQQSYVRTAPVD